MMKRISLLILLTCCLGISTANAQRPSSYDNVTRVLSVETEGNDRAKLPVDVSMPRGPQVYDSYMTRIIQSNSNKKNQTEDTWKYRVLKYGLIALGLGLFKKIF